MTATVNLAHHVKGAPYRYRHGWIPTGMPEPSHSSGSIGYDKNGDMIRDANGAVMYFGSDKEKSVFLAKRESAKRKRAPRGSKSVAGVKFGANAPDVNSNLDRPNRIQLVSKPKKKRAAPGTKSVAGVKIANTAPALYSNLSTDIIDLTPKWHHGYIPANAEALAIKEHRKPGSKPGAHAKTLADYKSYHDLATKRSMKTSDLLAHAEAHTAAAKRARSPESKAKHVAEARSARLVAAHRVRKVKAKAATPAPAGIMPAGLGGGTHKVHTKSRVTRKNTAEIARAIKGTKPNTKTRKQAKADVHVPGYEKTLDGMQLAREYVKAKQAGDTGQMKLLHNEAHKRVVAAEKLRAHAAKAKELIDTQWASVQDDPEKTSKFMAKLEKLLPGLAARLALAKAKSAGKGGKIDQKLKSVEYFKAVVEAFVDHSIEKFIGPIVGSGLAATGLAIFQAKGG